MIPKNIKAEQVLKAIEEIKRDGTPKGRSSNKFLLEFDGEYYPPKYILSLASKYASGIELKSSQFGGGKETNDFLRALGFDIVGVSALKKTIKPFKRQRETKLSRIHHDERCPKCKDTIKKLLEKVYGKVERNWRFEVGTCTEDFKDTPYYNKLKEIYETLQSHRGFKEFVKVKTLPRCDFFIPNPGFIVEFDESQHFTLPRKIALERYPEELELGFDRKRWIALCEKINAKDNAPPYRDEQRAWYDTLRDLIPSMHGLKPTIRLYAAEMEWCSLDPQNAEDVKTFQGLLEEHTFIEQEASASTRVKTVSSYPKGRRSQNLSSAVATVLTEVWGKITDGDKDCLIRDVAARVATKTQGPVVIVFPAGFYSDSVLADLFSRTVEKVAHALKAGDPDGRVCVCLGLDGLNNEGQPVDQLVVAISRRGPEAAGKKFYPTKYEKQFVNLGKPEKGEFGLGRVLRWPLQNGSTFYLAACYDGYGIANWATGTQKPTNAVLELIHGFDPPRRGNSGVGYYPRGLARASQNWNCPVFSAASFRDRYLSRDFPSGLWVQEWTKGWNAWSYQDNKMSPPDDRFELRQSGSLRALVQIWNVG